MDRRMMLAAVGAIAGSVPAFAQSTTSPGSAGATMGSATGPTPAGSPLGPAEMDHAMKTAMVGGASLKIANIGLERADHAMIKQFAKFEHDEQTTVAEILMSMDPSSKPPAPDEKMATVIEKLSKMQKGAPFDREFGKAQTEGHVMLLTIQETYLKVGKTPRRSPSRSSSPAWSRSISLSSPI